MLAAERSSTFLVTAKVSNLLEMKIYSYKNIIRNWVKLVTLSKDKYLLSKNNLVHALNRQKLKLEVTLSRVNS